MELALEGGLICVCWVLSDIRLNFCTTFIFVSCLRRIKFKFGWALELRLYQLCLNVLQSSFQLQINPILKPNCRPLFLKANPSLNWAFGLYILSDVLLRRDKQTNPCFPSEVIWWRGVLDIFLFSNSLCNPFYICGFIWFCES